MNFERLSLQVQLDDGRNVEQMNLCKLLTLLLLLSCVNSSLGRSSSMNSASRWLPCVRTVFSRMGLMLQIEMVGKSSSCVVMDTCEFVSKLM